MSEIRIIDVIKRLKVYLDYKKCDPFERDYDIDIVQPQVREFLRNAPSDIAFLISELEMRISGRIQCDICQSENVLLVKEMWPFYNKDLRCSVEVEVDIFACPDCGEKYIDGSQHHEAAKKARLAPIRHLQS